MSLYKDWLNFSEQNYCRITEGFPLFKESEIGKLKRLKKSLVVYGSAIGQPRQEELQQYLQENLSPEEFKDIVEDIMIDLSPPSNK